MKIIYHIRVVALSLAALLFLNTAFAEQSSKNQSKAHGLEFIAPEGRFAFRLELRQNGFDQAFDQNGDKQALGDALNGVNLNSVVFPDLAAFGAGASLGTTVFKTQVETERLEFTLGYGLTSDLTLGLIIPYGTVTTQTEFSVTGGNVGFNPAFNSTLPSSTTNPALLPVGLGATTPVGTAGVQSIISDASFGFAYDPIEKSQWSGFGDPTLGILWRFYQTDASAMIIGGGIRFGMAEQVDPDNLLEQAIDDGSTDFRLRGEYYRNLGSGFDVKVAAELTHQTEDKVSKRVPSSGSLLATQASKERLTRNLGDYQELDIIFGKTINNWRFATTFHRYVKAADRYQSVNNTDTSALEANTGLYANQWRASASWSGINAWQNKTLPFPLIAQLEIQNTYEGKNFPVVQDIYLQLTTFF